MTKQRISNFCSFVWASTFNSIVRNRCVPVDSPWRRGRVEARLLSNPVCKAVAVKAVAEETFTIIVGERPKSIESRHSTYHGVNLITGRLAM